MKHYTKAKYKSIYKRVVDLQIRAMELNDKIVNGRFVDEDDEDYEWYAEMRLIITQLSYIPWRLIYYSLNNTMTLKRNGYHIETAVLKLECDLKQYEKEMNQILECYQPY